MPLAMSRLSEREALELPVTTFDSPFRGLVMHVLVLTLANPDPEPAGRMRYQPVLVRIRALSPPEMAEIGRSKGHLYP